MRWPIVVTACLVVLLAGVSGCDEESWDCDCDLIVSNSSPCDLTIVVDGREIGGVRSDDTRRLHDVGCDQLTLEARDPSGENVELRHVDLHSCEDYYWRIDDCQETTESAARLGAQCVGSTARPLRSRAQSRPW